MTTPTSQLSETPDDVIEIRDYRLADRPLIFAKWLWELRRGNSWFNAIDKKAYFDHYHEVVEGILNHPDTETRIACLSEDPDTLIGYAIVSRETLHWVYIKRPFRGFGLTHRLVPPNITTVTHLTVKGKQILNRYPDIKFNPFAL